MNTDSKDSLPQRATIAVSLAIVALIVYRTSQTAADPDLWGHIRFGQEMLRTGEFVHDDPYSYLSGEVPWINHELLAELSSAWIYDSYGPPGLVTFKTGLCLLMLGLVYVHLRRRDVPRLRAGILVIVTMFLLLPGTQSIRPHLFTYVFFLFLILIIYHCELGRKWLLIAVPALIVAWLNSHGGVLAGAGLLALWAFIRAGLTLYQRRPDAQLREARTAPGWLLIFGILMASVIAAGLLNPFGFSLWEFLIRTGTVPRPDISEWQPIRIASPTGAAYAITATISLLGIAFSQRTRKPALVALFICLLPLPLMAVRHLQLFALGFAVFAGEHISSVWSRLEGTTGKERPPMSRQLAVLTIVAASLGIVLAGYFSIQYFRCIIMGPEVGFAYPVRAVALLKQAEVKGNLAVDFDWGEYVIWHLGPDVKISVDGRRETVYTSELMDENLRFAQGRGDWDDLLETRPTDLVLVKRALPVFNMMELKSGWDKVYEDELCGLFVREGTALYENVKGTLVPEVSFNGSGMCFPYPD